MLRSHRLGAIIEIQRLATKLLNGCACTVRWPALHLKLKLLPRPKNCHNRLSFDKAIAKLK